MPVYTVKCPIHIHDRPVLDANVNSNLTIWLLSKKTVHFLLFDRKRRNPNAHFAPNQIIIECWNLHFNMANNYWRSQWTLEVSRNFLYRLVLTRFSETTWLMNKLINSLCSNSGVSKDSSERNCRRTGYGKNQTKTFQTSTFECSKQFKKNELQKNVMSKWKPFQVETGPNWSPINFLIPTCLPKVSLELILDR